MAAKQPQAAYAPVSGAALLPRTPAVRAVKGESREALQGEGPCLTPQQEVPQAEPVAPAELIAPGKPIPLAEPAAPVKPFASQRSSKRRAHGGAVKAAAVKPPNAAAVPDDYQEVDEPPHLLESFHSYHPLIPPGQTAGPVRPGGAQSPAKRVAAPATSPLRAQPPTGDPASQMLRAPPVGPRGVPGTNGSGEFVVEAYLPPPRAPSGGEGSSFLARCVLATALTLVLVGLFIMWFYFSLSEILKKKETNPAAILEPSTLTQEEVAHGSATAPPELKGGHNDTDLPLDMSDTSVTFAGRNNSS